MEATRPRESSWLFWMATGLALTVAYGAAYAAIATPELQPATTLVCGGGDSGSGVMISQFPAECWVGYSAHRRVNSILEIVFLPANYLDRVLIPRRWPGKFLPSRCLEPKSDAPA